MLNPRFGLTGFRYLNYSCPVSCLRINENLEALIEQRQTLQRRPNWW